RKPPAAPEFRGGDQKPPNPCGQAVQSFATLWPPTVANITSIGSDIPPTLIAVVPKTKPYRALPTTEARIRGPRYTPFRRNVCSLLKLKVACKTSSLRCHPTSDFPPAALTTSRNACRSSWVPNARSRMIARPGLNHNSIEPGRFLTRVRRDHGNDTSAWTDRLHNTSSRASNSQWTTSAPPYISLTMRRYRRRIYQS